MIRNNVYNYELNKFNDLRVTAIELLKKFKINNEKQVETIIYENSKNKDEYFRMLKYLLGAITSTDMSINKNIKLNTIINDIVSKKIDFDKDNIFKNNDQEFRLEINKLLTPINVVEGIQCKRCKSKNTISTERQTRRADEPPTLFVKCLNCGYEWRD
jgi:DNA-directed RNA polymerase subunit M/transcription elongation factor TFIIS